MQCTQVQDFELFLKIRTTNDTKCPSFNNNICLCTKLSDCFLLNEIAEQRKFNELKNYESCGFDNLEPKYCCPLPLSSLGQRIGRNENKTRQINNLDNESEILKKTVDSDILNSNKSTVETTDSKDFEREAFFDDLNETCGESWSTRIFGGKEAESHEFPWMAGWS